MRKSFAFVIASIACLVPSQSFATETITYTYDANGQVVKVVHTGTVNNNLQIDYTIDDAENRDSVVVTGSPNPPPP